MKIDNEILKYALRGYEAERDHIIQRIAGVRAQLGASHVRAFRRVQRRWRKIPRNQAGTLFAIKPKRSKAQETAKAEHGKRGKGEATTRRVMSAAGRKAVSKAQKARWAKIHAAKKAA